MKKIINFCSFLFVFDRPPLRCFGPMSTVSISKYLLNDDKICEKNTSFDRSMIKLWEPVIRIILYGTSLALNRYKTCAVSMSDTGKQQFSANQSIYQLSDKDRSVPDDIDL